MMQRRLLRTLLLSSLTACASLSASAQNPSTAAPSSSTRTEPSSVNENFELNITERRITEDNFTASTSISAGEESARGLRLRIGVGVGAEHIDVLLRNVRGQVRFRATLGRVLELLNARQTTDAAP